METIQKSYDAIIIGAGVGGGAMANMLAKAGAKVLVIERGTRLPREADNWSVKAVFHDRKYSTRETWRDRSGAFRSREAETGVIPWADGQLLDGHGSALDEHPGLAAYWRSAERLWNDNRSAASKLSLRGQIDFQGKLTQQFPVAPQRVVYTKSGQHLAACRIEDDRAVIDHKLYWAAFASVPEARYLTAVLNSQALADAVAPLQARGQHNPRDFDLHVFASPFPAFDADDGLHSAIALLASHAEEVAASVDLDSAWQFQKARRVTREALREDGIADEIDKAVAELLASTVSPLAGAK